MNFDQAMKAYYKERDTLGIGKRLEEMTSQEIADQINATLDEIMRPCGDPACIFCRGLEAAQQPHESAELSGEVKE